MGKIADILLTFINSPELLRSYLGHLLSLHQIAALC